MNVDWKWIVTAAIIGGIVGSCGMEILDRGGRERLQEELERSVTECDARIERVARYQDILEEDLRTCKKDLNDCFDQDDDRGTQLYECEQSLFYCRKVCGEKDK